MKYLDKVRVISDKYEKEGIKKDDVVTILNAEIRYGTFEVVLTGPDGCDIADAAINVEDLGELVYDAKMSDQAILNGLPSSDPNWWCKVENGYILNLKGEKKNKIPYDYNS